MVHQARLYDGVWLFEFYLVPQVLSYDYSGFVLANSAHSVDVELVMQQFLLERAGGWIGLDAAAVTLVQ